MGACVPIMRRTARPEPAAEFLRAIGAEPDAAAGCAGCAYNRRMATPRKLESRTRRHPARAVPRNRTLPQRLVAGLADARDLLGGVGQSARQDRRCSCMAGRAPAPTRARAASSTRASTASSCSTSAVAVAAGRTRAWKKTPRGTSSRTWKCCASTSASTAGWCLAARGDRRWRWPMPRHTRSASPNWCCAASSCCASGKSTGSTSTARVRSFRIAGRRTSARSRKRERDDLVAAFYKRLTSRNRATQLKAAKAWSVWEGSTSYLLVNEANVDELGGGRLRHRRGAHRVSLLRQPGLLRTRGPVAAQRAPHPQDPGA